jgi:hypothetical protein
MGLRETLIARGHEFIARQDDVTLNAAPVTKIAPAVTINQPAPGRKRGRPPTGNAKTSAERVRAHRAKKNG